MSTYRSPLYRIWVVAGLIAVVAFAVIGGLSGPSDQDFVLYLIPVIAFAAYGAGYTLHLLRNLRSGGGAGRG